VVSTSTVYATDADNREVLEYDGASGAVQRWYAFGQGPDAVLNQMNAALGTRETMIPDLQGSIIGTLDSGGTLAKSGYQPYGENPAVVTGTYRYTARRFDPETAGSTAQPSGLYYYRARAYSPAWGRFLQPDQIGYAGGSNLYAYVGNDPLNNVDPTGDFAQITQNGNNIVINFPAQFIGSGATPAAIAAYSQRIAGAWTGTFGQYNVTTQVTTPAAGTPRSQYNVVDISPLAGNAANGSPFTNAVGGSYINVAPLTTGSNPVNEYNLNASDAYNLWAVGHEAGHAMGLVDMYNAQGPLSGYGTNIMAVPQGVPEAQDISNILYMNSIGYNAGNGSFPAPGASSTAAAGGGGTSSMK
jgi:RHS repeat-associated protein